MAGLSASGLKTQIKSYTETDSNVLTDAVLENIILNARPDRTEPAVARVLTLNPFKLTNSSTTVNVFEENHGRSTSDTVRFRNGEGSFGITSADINKSAGFTITKVDANNYTFTAAGTATASTNIGGGSVSAGPVTLVA